MTSDERGATISVDLGEPDRSGGLRAPAPCHRRWISDALDVATARLSVGARIFRAAHGAIAAAFLAAIGYVWWCALTGRRDQRLRLAVGALVTEGALVAANHGDCPLGGFQDRLGDPVPLFELVLSPTAARRAVPVLGFIATTGIVVLVRRRA